MIEAHSLRTDESALTGESVGVDKSPEPVAAEAALAERTSMVYGSTYVTHGTGLAVAVRTGMATEVGQIAATLGQMVERPTPFQVEVQKMARQMTVIVAAWRSWWHWCCCSCLHEPPLDVALNTLSLAVATIPESLPIVLTFALALGARQMARQQGGGAALVGGRVARLGGYDLHRQDRHADPEPDDTRRDCMLGGDWSDLPQDLQANPAALELLRAGILCNEATQSDGVGEVQGDPVDTALVKAALSAGLNLDQERTNSPRKNEIPFSSERKMMTTLHTRDGRLVAFTKGAPGPVLGHCSNCREGAEDYPLADQHCQAIRQQVTDLQGKGFYVLGVASREIPDGHALELAEQDLTFLGLLALIDPPRARGCGGHCKGTGSRHPGGDDHRRQWPDCPGDRRDTRDRAARGRRARNGAYRRRSADRTMKEVDIVARATPQVKQQVLQALQDAGHVVAMTGDGVNDATALKQSDVGVAMGLRGTDIAKESAAMVLLDDNFATIVSAVEEGRRIFDNIRKFTNYLLSTSLGEVFVVLALSIAGYFPLSAIMLLWVNVVTDLVPASALAADPVVPHVMRRRPRRHNEPILNKAIYATIVGSIFRTLIAYGPDLLGRPACSGG